MRRSTWILVLVLLGLAALWYLLDSGRLSPPAFFSTTATPTTEAGQFLYSPSEGTLSDIMIQDPMGNTTRIRRGAAGTWSMLQPEIAAADPSLAEAAATQAGDLRILVAVEGSVTPAVVGLDVPSFTLTLEGASGRRVFRIGLLTSTGSGYYVQTPDGKIVVVTKFGLDALINLLTSPPYAETPTPSLTAPAIYTQSAAPTL